MKNARLKGMLSIATALVATAVAVSDVAAQDVDARALRQQHELARQQLQQQQQQQRKSAPRPTNPREVQPICERADILAAQIASGGGINQTVDNGAVNQPRTSSGRMLHFDASRAIVAPPFEPRMQGYTNEQYRAMAATGVRPPSAMSRAQAATFISRDANGDVRPRGMGC